ncbi:Maf family protein [Microterricola pindariensis]|uniref:Nucleoside triphosphate pyrophosphatase n=1 Tax=Microterricola pindariensis TaxID=478010 RepID=A0ABX5AX96_9MICO|nr:nucleoside triphosphate pyrophosphatase [Microterricola pindariensis]PPL19500.1 septum formation protein Maf [Microterricola pindariensis]
MRLYLASTSPARLATLRAAGIEPLTHSPGVDEEALVARVEAEQGPLAAPDMVQLLAQAKAEAIVGAQVAGGPIDGLILGGDSAFLFDGQIFGKPHEPAVARERWLRQRGRAGELWSGHWLIDHRGGRVRGAVGRADMATVTFAEPDDAEVDAYIATGEPLSVAGAFTIDSLGGPFIRRVDGDPSTVVGLSLSTLRELVRELGVDWPSLWNRR